MTGYPMKCFRNSPCAPLLLGAILLLADTPAFARRPIEDVIFKAPMPHEQGGGGGDKIKVHYVSRHTLDRIGKGETVKLLQQEVQKCVASPAKKGAKLNPPKSWPDESTDEIRTDSYYTLNRGITYQHGVHYGVNYVDCSLVEMESSTALLTSSYGRCEIDLLKKTYQGECDPKGHEQAKVTPLPPMPSAAQQKADFAKMKANPATAAMAAAMQGAMAMADKPTGVFKTFDGVKCEVVAINAALKGTKCVMRGGSFVPPAEAEETGPGVTLELNLPNVGAHVADRVKLDAFVSASVFTPHLKGFQQRDGGESP
jgi:hypothetical protein